MNHQQGLKGWYSRGYLPHFDGGEIPQFVTIRLFDSVPGKLIQKWEAEIEQQESDKTIRSILLFRKIEAYADQGYGECWLRQPEIAGIVENSLLHFDGQRYKLSAWVVMPNHIHFLLTPFAGQSLPTLLQSIKTWTAKAANRVLRRSGRFWMPDYFDRYTRNEKHYRDVRAYIENNPVKAGLCDEPKIWRFSSAWYRAQAEGRTEMSANQSADGNVRVPAGEGRTEMSASQSADGNVRVPAGEGRTEMSANQSADGKVRVPAGEGRTEMSASQSADGNVRVPAGEGRTEMSASQSADGNVRVPAFFSSRFKWNLESNRLSRLIAEKRRAGIQLFDLTESNPTRAGFDFSAKEILPALANGEAMVYEPQPKGLLVAREAVAAYYAERGFAVEPERIHLTASTSEAYSYLFKLLANHGDEVLIPQPSYPLFEFLATLEGVELRPYELEYFHPQGWRIDFDSIKQAITPRTRAVILVNPNNPTGSFIKLDELRRLNQICASHNLALIVDEVFGDYGFGKDENRATSLVENSDALTFVMSGFSKILALPQMKLGWIVTNGPAVLRDKAIERLDLIADTFLSVGAPVQHAAPEWFKLRGSLQRQILDRVRGNCDWLGQRVEGSSARLLTVEGGWYATLEIPRHFTEEEWVLRLLAEENVLTHPGYFFDYPREAFLTLSLLPSREIFREAVGRILARML